MSNTPETDKYIHFNRIETEEERNLADFARRLERQRDEAQRKLDEHKIALESADKSNDELFVMLEKAREERDEAQRKLDELASAALILAHVAERNTDDGDEWERVIANVRKLAIKKGVAHE